MLELLIVFNSMIDVGVEKVILGSAAIKDKNFLQETCQKFPNKIALGLDAKDGYVVCLWLERRF